MNKKSKKSNPSIIKLENSEFQINLALKNLTKEELEKVKKKFNSIVNKLLKEQEKHNLNQIAFKDFLLTHKIQNNLIITKRKTKFTRVMKYTFQEKNGSTRFWSGVGKMPNRLKELLSTDEFKLNDFLIDKSTTNKE